MRLRARQRAARIEDIAAAYSGCQNKDGLDALKRRLDELKS
jgi:hypothetical protein